MPRGKHERALVRPRVRQREVRAVTVLAGHRDDVDVEGARPPAHHANPVERRLDLVQPVEELIRWDRDVGQRDGVAAFGRPTMASAKPERTRLP
jgi:hypothetical protein